MTREEPSRIEPERLLLETDWLRRLARGLVGDEATADDVVQSAWTEYVERPPGRAGAAIAWLSRVVRSTAYKWRRTERRRSLRERALARAECVTETPESLAMRAELHRELTTRVLELNEPYRSVVLRRYYEGMRPVDIARASGASEATVRSQLRRALVLLRGELSARHRNALSFAAGSGAALASTSASAAGASATSAAAFSAVFGSSLTGALIVSKPATLFVCAALACAGIGSGLWWLIGNEASELAERTPASDDELAARLERSEQALAAARRAIRQSDRRSRELAVEIDRLRRANRDLAARTSQAAVPAGGTLPVTEQTEAAAAWLQSIRPGQFGDITPEETLFLRELDLSGIEFGDAEVQHLLEMPSLIRLTVGGDGLTDAGFAELVRLERLEFLDVSGAQITGVGLASLVDSSLESLHLSHTPLTDSALVNLPVMPSLVQIKLNHTEVTDVGLAELARLQHLEHVELDGTTVTENGLAQLLERNPSIVRVEARRTAATSESERRLRAQYPECKFVTESGALPVFLR